MAHDTARQPMADPRLTDVYRNSHIITSFLNQRSNKSRDSAQNIHNSSPAMVSIKRGLTVCLSLALVLESIDCQEDTLSEEDIRYNDWNCRTNLINRVDSYDSVIESYYNKTGDECHVYCRVRSIGHTAATPPQYYMMFMPNFKLCGFLRVCLSGQCIGWYTPRIRPLRLVARGIYRIRQWKKGLSRIPSYFDSDPNVKNIDFSSENPLSAAIASATQSRNEWTQSKLEQIPPPASSPGPNAAPVSTLPPTQSPPPGRSPLHNRVQEDTQSMQNAV